MSYKTLEKPNRYTDKDWVRSIFKIDSKVLDGASISIRTWSSADTKFIDTALGGSLVINPLPQPNIFTDPPNSNHWLKELGQEGLSPYYSEAFDDNYRMLTMRFGTMAFTSLTAFLFNMYHPGAAALVNKGRYSSFLFSLGEFIGNGISLMTWPLQVAALMGKAVLYFLRVPMSRYCYLKPNMPLYWSSVQTIVNHFATDLGLLHRSGTIYNENSQDPNKPGIPDEEFRADHTQIDAMKAMWPNIYAGNPVQNIIAFNEKDGAAQIDAFAIATRAQRLAYVRHQALMEVNGNGGPLNVRELLKQAYRKKKSKNGMVISEYIEKWKNQGQSVYSGEYALPKTPEGLDDKDSIRGVFGYAGENSNHNGADTADVVTAGQIDKAGFMDFMAIEARDGGSFITFRVDDTGSVSESFSNTYRSSSLAEKINSQAASARSTYFDIAGGNIGDDILSETIEAVAGGVKKLFEGIVSGVGLEGLLVVGGGGTVDMPKYWESSDTQLPKPQYSFTLTSRYANRRAAFTDIYFPLACILAAVMPASTGKHSHSAPLYLEFFDKGRAQSRLAAIESLTITRGDGNMGFTPEGHLMSLNVSFNIIPMEEILAMPIMEGFKLGETFSSIASGLFFGGAKGAVLGAAKSFTDQLTKGLFDGDTPFMDYMAVLSSLGHNEQHYLMSKLKRRFAINQQNLMSAFSTARMASFTNDTLPGRIFNALVHPREFFLDEKASTN